MSLHSLYRKALPYETRLKIRRWRDRDGFDGLRTKVFPSEKGVFSLRSYDRMECIFVHITKTAGTSLALSLFGDLPYHHTAIDYRVIYGKQDFERYFKFAIVRNPWSRLFSAWNYLKAGGWDDDDAKWAAENLPHDDFNAFVEQWLTEERIYSHRHFWPQQRFICDGKGELLLDALGRFEDLERDFNAFAAHLGVETTLKATNRNPSGNYAQAFSSAAREKVAALYRADIELLGYSFEGYHTTLPMPAVKPAE